MNRSQETIKDRLKSHAKAFDGLLSLIPARLYYGEDTSVSSILVQCHDLRCTTHLLILCVIEQDQWQKKKQTKDQARQAQLAKLDPDNAAKSAKDVLDERARKRKREEEDGGSDIEGVEVEKPRQGLKEAEKKTKKQKREESAPKSEAKFIEPVAGDTSANAAQMAKAAKRKEKRERKLAKQATEAEKRRLQCTRKEESAVVTKAEETKSPPDKVVDDADDIRPSPEVDPVSVPGLSEPQLNSSPSHSPEPHSPIFDIPLGQSGTSSTSSIVPPTAIAVPKKALADSEEARVRLKARLEVLRAKRKADGPNGGPARNRQELLETRRRQKAEASARKKEMKRKAKEEERLATEQALRTRSPPDVGSPLHHSLTASENNFSFGRIAFNDGQQMDPGLTNLLDARKRKGPQDPLGALKAAENKRSRLSGLDEAKRADIEEKDTWLNARKRAYGDRVRDDTSLLKKTLKRKEKAKNKSEKEWKDRLEGVEKGKAFKQKKREDNLRKRREEKGGKGKKVAKKVKNRPGFEGSFRAKAGSKKK